MSDADRFDALVVDESGVVRAVYGFRTPVNFEHLHERIMQYTRRMDVAPTIYIQVPAGRYKLGDHFKRS